MSLHLAWLPDVEKTSTSTEDCKCCCSERSSVSSVGGCPRTPWSSTTDINEPRHRFQRACSGQPVRPNPSACKAGTFWHSLLPLGAMCLISLQEKPSVKTQILGFFERHHIYLAVASSWCHCSCNMGYSAPWAPHRSHRWKSGCFTPNKSEHLPHALLLSLDACDTDEHVPVARVLLLEQEHGLDSSSESATFITSGPSMAHLIWPHC